MMWIMTKYPHRPPITIPSELKLANSQRAQVVIIFDQTWNKKIMYFVSGMISIPIFVQQFYKRYL